MNLLKTLRKANQNVEQPLADKSARWLVWAVRHLQQRGKTADLALFCGQGNYHLVGEERTKIGNGFGFKSLACSGCRSGRRVFEKLGVPVLKKTKSNSIVTITAHGQEQLRNLQPMPCWLCTKFYVVTPLPIKAGDVVGTQRPALGISELTPAKPADLLKDFAATDYVDRIG